MRKAAVWVGVVVLVAAGWGVPSAGAQGEVILIDDAGDGFVADPPVALGLGGQQRTYRHRDGEMTVQGLVLPPGMSASTFVDTYVATVGADMRETPTSIDGARAFHLGRSGGFQVSSMISTSATAVFVATLQTDVGASWEPLALLEQFARRQIAASGGPNRQQPASEPSPELIRYLPTEETISGPYRLLGVFGATEDLSDDIGADPRLVEFLSRNTVSAFQVWSTATDDVFVGVDVTRYPYERFAAAVQGSVLDGEVRRTTIPGISGVIPGAIAFEGVGTRAGEVGAVFRRGRFTFTAIADRQDEASRDAVAGIIGNLAAVAPDGAGDAQRLPSSARSIVLSAVLVIGFGLALILARALLTRHAVRTRSVSASGAARANDASADARALRRSAVGLTAVQLATWAAAIVGFAADAATALRVGIVVAAIAGGFAVTAWWRRRELAHVGLPPPRWRPTLPGPGGIALGAVGLGCFLLGMAAVVWGLRELVFVPSLTHLQWCDRLGVSPRALAIAITLGGALTTVVATTVLRRARSHGRSNAAEVRSSDPRRPVLYLRSFEDDDVALPCVLSARRPFLELFTLRASDPFEESLAWELATYGPVTAVGRPGSRGQRVGAAREYFSNETWKPHVRQRMGDAVAIAVVIGRTDGLEWEVETIASEGHLHKTVFFVPPGDPESLRRRWATTQSGLPEDLRPADLDLTSVLSVKIAADGSVATVVDRRDEAAYRVAVDYALAPYVLAPSPLGGNLPS